LLCSLAQAIKVNWGVQSIAAPIKKDDVTGPTFHVFIGDLSSEVTDQVLLKAFQPFGKIALVLFFLCLPS